MFRSFLAVTILAFSINNAYASDLMDELFSNLIYGVAVINQSVDITMQSPGSSVTTSEDGTGFGIFADKYYRGKYRFNGSFNYVDYDNFYIDTLTASADYLFPYNANITFFTGATVGAGMQVYSDSSIGDASIGLIYGVQLGGIAYINKNLMLELGYRLRPTDMETEFAATGAVGTVDELSETYLSILLMF
ncbi:MAG: hypothetical protein OQL06_00285 [Gammaproteobacteria bacterium]|nr:hypothetical protein [Gammaproteobacteria bacterium]